MPFNRSGARFVVGLSCGFLGALPAVAQDPTTAAEPAGRRHVEAVFHPGLGEIVIAGGGPPRSAQNGTAVFDDVWSWNGERWRLIANTGTAQMC